MLRIVNASLTPGRQMYIGSSHSHFSVGSMRLAVFRDLSTSVGDIWRSKFDYLHQGGKFDQFDNKSVSNRQIEGTFVPEIKVNGQSSTAGAQAGSGNRFFKPSASVKIGSYWYALPQVSPVEMGGLSRNSSVTSVTAILGTAIGVRGKECPCVVTTVINVSRSTGVVSASCRWIAGSIQPSQGSNDLAYVCQLENIGRHAKKTDYEELAAYIPAMLGVARSYLNVAELAYFDYLRSHPAGPSFSSRTNISSFECGSVSREDVEQWERYIAHFTTHIPFDAATRSGHARELIEALNDFDSNMLAYGSDLRKTGDTIRTLLKLPRDIKSPKAWASAWLSGRYGDRLAVADTRQLLSSIQRKMTTRKAYALARKTIVGSDSVGPIKRSTRRTSTIVAADDSYNGVMSAIYNLMKWDVWPTLENTWDMVPLSFVVDWILPVSDILGQIDAAVEAPYIKPMTEYVGTQTVTRLILNDVTTTLTGTLECKYYTRRRESILSDIRPFEANITFLPSFSVINAGDALALTTTLRRR